MAEWLPYNLGAACKYLVRAGKKPNTPAEEDLRKAITYIEREITRLAHSPTAEPTDDYRDAVDCRICGRLTVSFDGVCSDCLWEMDGSRA